MPITDGGVLVINTEAVGDHDYVVYNGPVTIDGANPFQSSDWFSATADSRSAWCVVKGDMTIGAGQMFRPSARKLFTVLYVDGDLTVDGAISMGKRGANHSLATGSDVAAAPLRIATGTFSGVEDPEVPAVGGAGADHIPDTSHDGVDGTDGVDGATGGGATGASSSSPEKAGDGADGTSWSGGPGGGGNHAGDGEDGAPDGGKGGDGGISGSPRSAGGGAGNPGGEGVEAGGHDVEDGEDGTGGILIVICTGELSGDGLIEAPGGEGGDADIAGGGGSGGGSVTVLYGTDVSTITPSAVGGAGGVGGNRSGGKGGDGTARKLAIPA